MAALRGRGVPLRVALVAATLVLVACGLLASGIAVIPIFFWELSLGLWLTFKGFRPAAVAALASDTTDANGSIAANSSPIATTTAGAA
jgi:hypothetical protein